MITPGLCSRFIILMSFQSGELAESIVINLL